MSYDIMFMHKDESPLTEAEKNEIAGELQRLFPELVPFQRDYDAIARHEKTSVEEARQKYTHIELNSETEPNDGLQISIDTGSIFITVPYWHTGDKAEQVFNKIARCGKLLGGRGLMATDNQLDKEVLFDRDLREMIDVYQSMSGRLDSIARKFPVNKRKSWWKFW